MILSLKEIKATLQNNRYLPTVAVNENDEVIAVMLYGFGYKEKFRVICEANRRRIKENEKA